MPGPSDSSITRNCSHRLRESSSRTCSIGLGGNARIGTFMVLHPRLISQPIKPPYLIGFGLLDYFQAIWATVAEVFLQTCSGLSDFARYPLRGEIRLRYFVLL